jgi:hypothetical protein
VGCGGREGGARRAMLTRTAKSCGPGAATLALSSRGTQSARATVAKEPVHRGERDISRKTSAQGRPDVSGVPVVSNSCAFDLCTRGRGCTGHPVFPAPSDFIDGHIFLHSSGVWRRGNARLCRATDTSFSYWLRPSREPGDVAGLSHSTVIRGHVQTDSRFVTACTLDGHEHSGDIDTVRRTVRPRREQSSRCHGNLLGTRNGK